MSRVVTSLLLTLLLAACSGVDDSVVESAETVLTLQSGTINELRQKRGIGLGRHCFDDNFGRGR